MQGIYMIVNLVNNKRYIGSSNDIKQRWRRHLSDLRLNRHDNQYLQRAFNKYGEGNFKFTILEKINTESDLLDKEKYYIKLYKADYNVYGYNLIDARRNGEFHCTEKMREARRNARAKLIFTDEIRQKLSDSHKGEKHHNTKLTDEIVKAIKVDLKNGELKNKEIAVKYTTTEGIVSKIKHNKSWTHIKID